MLILFFLTGKLCRGEKMSEFPFHRKFKYFNIWFCPKNSDERKKFWKKFCFEHVKKMQLIWHYHASASSSTMPPGSRNFHGLYHHSSWTGSFEEATSALMFILMTGALSVWVDTSSLICWIGDKEVNIKLTVYARFYKPEHLSSDQAKLKYLILFLLFLMKTQWFFHRNASNWVKM